MKHQLLLCMIVFGLCSCSVQYNPELVAELEERVHADQEYQRTQLQKKNTESYTKGWDSLVKENCTYAQSVLKKYGFPGFNRVGESGSKDFFILVQHCDHNPKFQKKVANKMRIQYQHQNAHKTDFAYLTDRYLKNLGKPQIYGTQMVYDSLGDPKPYNLINPEYVDIRRMDFGLEPLDEYIKGIKEVNQSLSK